MRTTRLLALRQATAEVHEALHHAPPFARMAAGRASRRDVDHVLRMHWHAWSGFDHESADRVYSDAFALPAAGLFRLNQLAALVAPRATTPPDPIRPGAALGASYVYLGSKMGGAILGRQLAAAGFLDAAAYMAPGEHDRRNWHRLGPAIDSLDADGFRACQRAACAVFEQFRTASHEAASAA
ncbi:heme oxygenase-like domain-containing protein [Maricaulis sp. CAU 1757]